MGERDREGRSASGTDPRQTLPEASGPRSMETQACPVPQGLWARRESDHSFTVGLREETRQKVGRITAFRGPVPGSSYRSGDPVVSIESDKWVGHFPLPMDGIVVAVNESLYQDPSPINRDPQGSGWLFRYRPSGTHGPEADPPPSHTQTPSA